MPAAILSSVVLPEPDGPSRHSTSPGSAVSVTSRSVSACAPKEWLMCSKASRAAKVTPAVTRGCAAGSCVQRCHDDKPPGRAMRSAGAGSIIL